MNENWKGKTVPHKPQYWRLVLLFIAFMFLEAFLVCIVGPAMQIRANPKHLKENPECCPTYKVWHDIWKQ
jgi:hypothetical protein